MIRSCYIHIPFCEHICSYCDFSKMYYHKEWSKRYLNALEKEIHSFYKGEELDTIYIGGGTPSSLSVSDLKHLFNILDTLKRSPSCEFTIECNIENITEEKLKLFKKMGVNRLSIGIESSNSEILSFLERPYSKEKIISTMDLVKQSGFSNINVDLMYAIPIETMNILLADLDFILSLKVSHISTYSLMIEEHTKLSLKNMTPIDQELDLKMYETIHQKLIESGYEHYEISNFAKPGFQSKHNMTYWRNEKYYGFGLGASGFIHDIRYSNTRSFQDYEKGKYREVEEKISKQLDMENEIMLGFRTMEGISKDTFKKKFGYDFRKIDVVPSLLEQGKLIETETSYYIPFRYWYISNEILIHFIKEVE